MNAKEQETWNHMEQNRQFILRCLVCMNLCPNCINEWHGVDMSWVGPRPLDDKAFNAYPLMYKKQYTN